MNTTTTIINSPIGPLTLTERDGALVRLSFGAHGPCDPPTPLLRRATGQLNEYFAGTRQEFDLPLEPSGTEFQLACWRALSQIPYGETRSYGEQARNIGRPDRARAVGASNTLWYENGRLHSTNTDVEGFTANLDACVPGWEKRAGEAVVLGAGGSARAVIYGLIERGIGKINVVNRTPERAQALQVLFGPVVQPIHWAALPHLFSRTGLVVNTTSLGMTGQPPLAIDLEPLPRHAVVADLVYAPLETPLLAAARARNLAVADGLGMLLYQAVRGFQMWFGVRPDVTPQLRALVETDLGK